MRRGRPYREAEGLPGLRLARERAGLKQDELAALIGARQHTISTAETGRRHPKPSTLTNAARALGVLDVEAFGVDETPRTIADAARDLVESVERAQARAERATSPTEALRQLSAFAKAIGGEVQALGLQLASGKLALVPHSEASEALDRLTRIAERHAACVRRMAGAAAIEASEARAEEEEPAGNLEVDAVAS